MARECENHKSRKIGPLLSVHKAQGCSAPCHMQGFCTYLLLDNLLLALCGCVCCTVARRNTALHPSQRSLDRRVTHQASHRTRSSPPHEHLLKISSSTCGVENDPGFFSAGPREHALTPSTTNPPTHTHGTYCWGATWRCTTSC